MRVLDASVLVEVLVDGPLAVSSQLAMLENPGWLWAPYLIDAEVGHALRGVVRAGKMTARAARGGLEDMMDWRLQRVAHEPLVDRAWQLRENLSFYDGLYVALAEAMKAPLLTLDSRLAGATGVKAEIELIA